MVDMTATIPRSNAWRGSTLLRFVLNRRTCRSKEPALTQKSTQEGNGGGEGLRTVGVYSLMGSLGERRPRVVQWLLLGLRGNLLSRRGTRPRPIWQSLRGVDRSLS